jgi:FkbM family methyltransferase
MWGVLKSAVRDRLAKRLEVPEIPVALSRLASLGFRPASIFDVGAYHGDFARLCLSLWPDARVTCFEAQAAAVERLQKFAAGDSRVTVVPTLVGAQPRAEVALYEAETASSVLTEAAGPRHPAKRYPMTTIDDAIAQSADRRTPNLLKIDVQGYELEVLRGAASTLASVDAVLAEINLLDIHEDVPLLADIVDWLARRGFVTYDICGLTRRPLDRALWQCDMIFVPAASRLRSDKRWARASAS